MADYVGMPIPIYIYGFLIALSTKIFKNFYIGDKPESPQLEDVLQ